MAIKKVKITIMSLEDSFKESKKVATEIDKGIFKKRTPIINFTEFETYKKMLTQKRLEMLETIKSKKPKNIKELANISKRDFKNVYEDIKILKELGMIKLKKTPDGLMPTAIYDEIDIKIKMPMSA